MQLCLVRCNGELVQYDGELQPRLKYRSNYIVAVERRRMIVGDLSLAICRKINNTLV